MSHHFTIKDAITKVKDNIEHFGEKEWQNWDGNQRCTPDEIFRPVNLHDLKHIVKKARNNKKKIRCAAAGHTWSSLSITNGYLVIVTNLNDIEINYNEKLKTWTVTTEAGVYLKDLDIALRKHNPPLAMNSATVLNTATTSGIVSTGCHGARCENSTISDRVISFQILTYNGELEEFSDQKNPIEMSLFGIIYKLTFQVEPMYNLLMKDILPNISDYWKKENLKNDVLNSDSVEIFYWPFNTASLEEKNDRLWVKTWKRTNSKVTEDQIEVKLISAFQNFELKFADNLYKYIANNPESTPFFTNLLFNLGVHESEKVLQAPDAIHYQTGIDNIPCMDVEFAFKVNDDFSNVIDEFNYIIKRVYELAADKKYPINLAAEFRINKASQSLFASTYDKDPNAYYCLLEILSVNGTQDYHDFSIELAERWMEKYDAQPHWGKLWEHIPGIIPHVRKHIGSRLEIFEKIRAKYDPDEYFFDNKSLRQILDIQHIPVLVFTSACTYILKNISEDSDSAPKSELEQKLDFYRKKAVVPNTICKFIAQITKKDGGEYKAKTIKQAINSKMKDLQEKRLGKKNGSIALIVQQ
ncbi:6750_t:CDS:2, partial [Scutellospora calospora]